MRDEGFAATDLAKLYGTANSSAFNSQDLRPTGIKQYDKAEMKGSLKS